MPSHYVQSCFRSLALRSFYTYSFTSSCSPLFYLMFFFLFLCLALSLCVFNMCLFFINVAQILHYMVTHAHYTHNQVVSISTMFALHLLYTQTHTHPESSHSSIFRTYIVYCVRQASVVAFNILSHLCCYCLLSCAHFISHSFNVLLLLFLILIFTLRIRDTELSHKTH